MEQQLFGTENSHPHYDSLGLVIAVFLFGTENSHPHFLGMVKAVFIFGSENSPPRPGSPPAHPVSPLGCFRRRPLVIALPH